MFRLEFCLSLELPKQGNRVYVIILDEAKFSSKKKLNRMKNITQLVSLEQQLNSTTVFSSCYIRSECIQLNLSISENIVPGKPILSRRVRPISMHAWILCF